MSAHLLARAFSSSGEGAQPECTAAPPPVHIFQAPPQSSTPPSTVITLLKFMKMHFLSVTVVN